MNDVYRSAKSLSIFAIVGLAVVGLCQLLSVFVGTAQIISPESAVDLDEPTGLSIWLLMQGIIALLQIPASIAAIVLFLLWLYRAHKNLSALRPTNLQFTSGWAVGWWFIPFANLVKPFQVVREVWCESDPEVDEEPVFLSASLHSAPVYMGVWWAFWLLSNVFSNISSRYFDPGDLSTVTISGYLFVLTGAISAIAAALAIYVIRDTTERQEARSRAVATSSYVEPPPPPSFGQSID